MSLSKAMKKITDKGKPWARYEMEAFEPFSSPKEKNKTDFVHFTSLQLADEKNADFVPFNENVDSKKKREEAKKRAEDIMREAREKAEQLEQAAYEEGFAQGEKDGVQLGEKKAVKVMENIEHILIEMSDLKKGLIKKYEKEILEMIFATAKKIIHIQTRSDGSAIEGTVLKALHMATDKSRIILKVNPEDFNYVERLRPEIFTKFEDLKSVAVNSDPSVTRGGCVIETPYGDVDARIETQLEQVYESLERSFAQQ